MAKLHNRRHMTTTRIAKRVKRAMRRLQSEAYLTTNGGYGDSRIVLVPYGWWYQDARSRQSQVVDVSSPVREIWHFQTSIGKAKPHLIR